METELITSSSDRNDAGQFLEDPSLYRDTLPQPYRSIDRILSLFIDDVWTVISTREEERDQEASKLKPSSVLHCAQIKLCSTANCLVSSPDEAFIVVGLSDGFVILDAASHAEVFSWSDSEVSVEYIHVTTVLKCSQFLFTTVDGKGVVRLFYFEGAKLYLLDTLGQDQDTAPQIKSTGYTVCLTSQQSEYLAIHFGRSGDRLEVYELPRDVWVKEVDEAFKQEQEQNVAASELIREPMKNVTFSKSSLLMKISSQGEMRAGYSLGLSVSKGSSTPAKVIVNASASSTINQAVLGACQKNFEKTHKPKCVPECLITKNNRFPGSPRFHFLISSEELCSLSDSSRVVGSCADKYLVVWWHGLNIIRLYSLTKTMTKGSEANSDLEWPVFCNITASAVSYCGISVSFVLSNCSIVTWNRKTGQRLTVKVNDGSAILQLEYLNKCCCCGVCYCQLPRCSHSNYLLVRCTSGKLYQLFVGAEANKAVIEDKSFGIISTMNIPTYLSASLDNPEVSLIRQQSGKVYIYDMCVRHLLCEAVMPQNYSHLTAHIMQSTTALLTSKTLFIFVLGSNNIFFENQQYEKYCQPLISRLTSSETENTVEPILENTLVDENRNSVHQAGFGVDIKETVQRPVDSLQTNEVVESEGENQTNGFDDKRTTDKFSATVMDYKFEYPQVKTVIDDVERIKSSIERKPLCEPCSVFVYSFSELLQKKSCIDTSTHKNDFTATKCSLGKGMLLVDEALRQRTYDQEIRKQRLYDIWLKMTEACRKST